MSAQNHELHQIAAEMRSLSLLLSGPVGHRARLEELARRVYCVASHPASQAVLNLLVTLGMSDKNPAAVALGKLGGAARSERKTMASRANAARPRPNRRPKSQNATANIAESVKDAGFCVPSL